MTTLNLGSGQGLSVLDVVNGFEASMASRFPDLERRPGDVPKLNLPQTGRRSTRLDRKAFSFGNVPRWWAWQSANPNGYHPLRPSTTPGWAQ